MKQKAVQVTILIIALFFILNLGKSIHDLWQKGDIVAERRQIREELREKNLQLKKEQTEVESSAFIEEQARNKLNLTREGEVVVVLPSSAPTASIAPPMPSFPPNWQMWKELFY